MFPKRYAHVTPHTVHTLTAAGLALLFLSPPVVAAPAPGTAIKPDVLPNLTDQHFAVSRRLAGNPVIRLAYADQLTGPWRIYQPGTLQLSQAPGARGHIASPDVHVAGESGIGIAELVSPP